jgi:hydrogenase expression/formation protein HypC
MCLGIPGRVIEITDAANNLALADFNGVKRVINLACVVDPTRTIEDSVGDWVLVHVGFAMSRIDEREAAETLRVLDMLGEAQAEMMAIRNSA